MTDIANKFKINVWRQNTCTKQNSEFVCCNFATSID